MQRKQKGDAGPENEPTSRVALLVAFAVSWAISSFVPFGHYILYPFTLLTTWVHEMGHGSTALLLGGSFTKLEIFSDASGIAWSQTGSTLEHGVVALGGLVAPPLVGVFVFFFARGPKRARVLLVGLAMALVVSLALWVRSFTGMITVPLLAILIGAFAWFGSGRERMFLAQLIGLRLVADTLTRGLDYLWTDQVTIQGEKSNADIAIVAEGFGGPRVMWSMLVSGLCLALVLVSLYVAWRGQAKPRSVKKTGAGDSVAT